LAATLRPEWPDSPVGIWKVTTEGDEEGRTEADLGTWQGHIADIAAGLADKCMWRLNFIPSKASEDLPEPSEKRKDVDITLDRSSGTRDMDPTRRAAAVLEWMRKEPTKYAKYSVKGWQNEFSIVNHGGTGTVFMVEKKEQRE